VVISGAVSPDDFTQPLVDSPFTRQILNSPSTTWECEISLCATTSKHYPAVVWRSCQLRIENRIAVSIAKIVEPGCSPGEFAPPYSHSLPHRPLSVLWKCSADYPELFDAPPNCQSGLAACVCSRLQLLLLIKLGGFCDGHLLDRRLLIQSSGPADRVNRAFPFWLCLGRFVIWSSDQILWIL
jgi:hypothetical protein